MDFVTGRASRPPVLSQSRPGTRRVVAAVRKALVLLLATAVAACGSSSHGQPASTTPSAPSAVHAYQSKLVNDGVGFTVGIGGCTHLSDPGGLNQNIETYCTNIVNSSVQSVDQLLTDLAPANVPPSLASRADDFRGKLHVYLPYLQQDQASIKAGKWSEVIGRQDAADQAESNAENAYNQIVASS